MPSYIITGPDGKKYKVTGADAQGALNALRKQLGDVPAPQTVADGKTDSEVPMADKAVDAAKSFGTGIEQGTIGLLNIGGDIASFAKNSIGGLFGFTPEQLQAMDEAKSQLGIGVPATSEQVTQKIESVQGPLYKPKTTVGKYANTVGQFVPGAVAGPGGFVRKAALSVVPGVASEAAGQATDGTALEPYARVAGALAGGLTVAQRGNVGTKGMLKNVGKSDEAYAKVEAATNAAYEKLRAAGVRYDANAVDQSIAEVSQLRINPQLAPDSAGLRDTFAQHLGKGMDFQDLDEMEQLATGILRDHNAKPADKFFTATILKKIKDIRESGAIATNGSVPANQINPLIKEAKDLARRRIIARDIGKMKDKAEWYVSGPESGLRNQFKSYGSKNGRNLSKAEEAAFKSVVAREGGLNIAHSVGSRMGATVMGAAGLYTGQIIPALIGMVGSAAARKFMEVYTKAGVEKAIRTVLAGRSEQEKAAVRDAIARANKQAQLLLTAEGARQGTQTSAPAVPVPNP